MKMLAMCPNCANSPVDGHPENGCLLAALIQVLRERGEKEESDLQKIHAECSTDRLWDVLGPVVDRLGSGEFEFVENAGEKRQAPEKLPPAFTGLLTQILQPSSTAGDESTQERPRQR